MLRAPAFGHQALVLGQDAPSGFVPLGSRFADQIQGAFGILRHAASEQIAAGQGELEAWKAAGGLFFLEKPDTAPAFLGRGTVGQPASGGGKNPHESCVGLDGRAWLEDGRQTQRQLDGGPRHAADLACRRPAEGKCGGQQQRQGFHG